MTQETENLPDEIFAYREALCACYKFASYSDTFGCGNKHSAVRPNDDRYLGVILLHPEKHPKKIVYYGSNSVSVMFWFRDPSIPRGEYVNVLYNVCFDLGDLGPTDKYLSELCKDKSLDFVDAKSHIAGPDVFNAGQRFLDKLRCFRPENYELKNVNMSHGFPTQVKQALGWTLNDLHMHAFHKKYDNEDDTAPVYWFSPRILLNDYGKKSINKGDYLRGSGTPGKPFEICFMTMPFGIVSQEVRDDTTKEIMARVSDYTKI